MVDDALALTGGWLRLRYAASWLCGLATETAVNSAADAAVAVLFTTSERNPHAVYNGHCARDARQSDILNLPFGIFCYSEVGIDSPFFFCIVSALQIYNVYFVTKGREPTFPGFSLLATCR